ncbi:biotin/lipoyl-binding protein [Polaromonas sp. P2-4]|nr:biotin/lipoyl-binding protein [Polaromonas sp. P2-4]
MQRLLGVTLVLAFCFDAHAAVFDCLMEPTQSVDISSPVVGLLDKVLVKRGDRVAKGQVIAALESRAEAAATAVARFKSEMTAPSKTAESKIEFSKRNFIGDATCMRRISCRHKSAMKLKAT